MGEFDSGAVQTGSDIRTLRKSRGKTIAEVAAALDRSTGWLSQVERGMSRVNAEQLSRFASVLDVHAPLLVMDQDPQDDPGVVRAERRRPYGRRTAGLSEELVTPGLDSAVEMTQARFEPRSALVTPVQSAPEEIIYILSGRLVITVDGNRTDLRRGDSMRLRDTRYAWENPSGAMTVALWIRAPAKY